jgi:hypothetical protein
MALFGDLHLRCNHSSAGLDPSGRSETAAAGGGGGAMGERSGRGPMDGACSCRVHRGGGRVLTLPRRRQVATPSGPSRRSLHSLRVSLLGYRIFRPVARLTRRPLRDPGHQKARNILATRPSRRGGVSTSTTRKQPTQKGSTHHGNRKQRHHRRQPHPRPRTPLHPGRTGQRQLRRSGQQRLDRQRRRAARVGGLLRHRGVGQAGRERRPVPLQGPRGPHQRAARLPLLGDRRRRPPLQGRDHRHPRRARPDLRDHGLHQGRSHERGDREPANDAGFTGRPSSSTRPNLERNP